MDENQKKPFYITTPIYYPSDKLHIGHTYCTVATDTMARYKRLQGYDVMFLTGTDEHGQKIEDKAKEAGVTPKQFVDNIVEGPRGVLDLWKLMNISNDRFIRTTDDYHELSVQKIFKKLYEKGDIYKGKYVGKYCKPCESFWTETQLVDGKCPDCGRPVVDAEEEAYFFRLSKYADRIQDLLENTDFLQPRSRVNEMINNFIKPGLEDLCVSRTSFSWGVPVDFDPGHVVYVWIDALSNYINALGYENDRYHDFDKFWPADLHLIGKDIIRFHTIYWPIFLMALDLPLPKQVFGHPWLLQGDGKMSKSKGNVLYADTLVNFFGVDAVRYFVLHEMPFDNDGVISWELMVERLNSDLANILGNLVNRTISMSNKYFGGTVRNGGAAEEVDEDLKAVVLDAVKKTVAKMDQLRVADAITEIFGIFRRCNKYIDETMPWALAKDEDKKDRLATVLYNLVEAITIGASLLESFMPETSEKILSQLQAEKRSLEQMDTFGLYPSGGQVTDKPEILFARMDVKEVLEKAEKIQAEQAAAAAENGAADAEENQEEPVIDIEAKPEISYDDFAAMQFQVGEIISCEAVPKSKKLLCSQVKIGSQVKQIVSGIKAHYSPEEMVGKKVMVLVNLKPAKLAGVMSEGMILCAEDADGNLSLMVPEKKMPAGAEIC